MLIRVLDIYNIGRSAIEIDVAEPQPLPVTGTGFGEQLFGVGGFGGDVTIGTDITSFEPIGEEDFTGLTGGSNLFDGAGIVKLLPGRRFTIEEYRVNLGQIENLRVNRQIAVCDLLRDQEALFFESN